MDSRQTKAEASEGPLVADRPPRPKPPPVPVPAALDPPPSSTRSSPQSTTGPRFDPGRVASQATSGGFAGLASAAAQLSSIRDVRELGGLGFDTSFDESDLRLRDVEVTSYVSRQRMAEDGFDATEVDNEGLPLVYNEAAIAAYWSDKPGELAGRWTNFAGVAAPWLTRLANTALQGKLGDPASQKVLASAAVDNLQRLGPTFIKLGQILSIRPDILPPAVMGELGRLQDKIAVFPTDEARATIERELGVPVDEIFSSFSAEPVAAASLAQVYRATVRATGQEVAVKVQRPGALSTVSKDLYVLRRAIGVYEKIITRFTAQTTDYQTLLSTFAEGLYTEMDFRNEALNARRMTELLLGSAATVPVQGIHIPQPLMHLTTRRVMTMEWVSGVKLTTLEPEEIRQLAAVGQEAFLVQLLEVGFFHGDPHPGNLLKVVEGEHVGKLALLDFGLVAEVPQRDREAMVSATIHLSNKDWGALVDDFCDLGFLPRDCDRRVVVPVMDRVLSPYLKGGGAQAFSFSDLSTDLLAATLEIPFSVPPYMSLLARSVATLEGIALAGDPGYQMVAQAYPFVVRKVLRNDSRGTGAVLRELLFDSSTGQLRPARLGGLLNAALGRVAEAEGFIDFDAVPEDSAGPAEIVSFLLSPQAASLRPWLVNEAVTGVDLALRASGRLAALRLEAAMTPRLPVPAGLLPSFLPTTMPTLLPPVIPVPGRGFVEVRPFIDAQLPELDAREAIYLESLTGLAASVLGVQPSDLELDVLALMRLVQQPSAEARELGDALRPLVDAAAAVSSSETEDGARAAVAVDLLEQIADTIVSMQAERAGVPGETLFPWYTSVRQIVRDRLGWGGVRGGVSGLRPDAAGAAVSEAERVAA